MSQAVKQIEHAGNIVETSYVFNKAKRLFPNIFGRTSLFERLKSVGQEGYNFSICVKPNEFGTHDDAVVKFIVSEDFTVYT